MSTTRLTFLYPHLFRSIRAGDPVINTTCAARQAPRRPDVARCFSTTQRRRKRLIQRHGKAVEPFLGVGEASDSVKIFTPDGNTSEEPKKATEPAQKDTPTKSEPTSPGNVLSEETQAAMTMPGDKDNGTPLGKNKNDELPTPMQQAATNTAEPAAPLETILHMPPPKTQEEENTEKPPHLRTPPYVHHFDTYTLVQQVERGGFTAAQSITTMKAVRGLLAENMDMARRGLVSKSDVENESYLFRAACSELRTEVQNQRKASDEKMRRERTLLQHESDILSQKITQELGTLRDEMKSMFDDQKMTVRGEQRKMDSGIQQLNYKITVDLNSDSKSEVEGVRWVLTRRSVTAILIMAFMVLSSLRYGSWKAHEEEARRKKEEVKHNDRKEDLGEVSAAEILAAN